MNIRSVCVAWMLLCLIHSATVNAQEASQAKPAKLLQQWKMTADKLSDQRLRSTTNRIATVTKPASIDENNLLAFEGGQFLTVTNGAAQLPQNSFSVEAWVRIDQPTRWGCIFGFQQDNRSYEKGWSLGYQNNRFEFRCSDGIRIVNATGAEFKLKQWYHVVGLCDGAKNELRLYVNGKQAALAKFTADGPVYPDKAMNTELVIGAYKDKDELFPLQGRIREVRLYDGLLTEKAIIDNAAKSATAAQSQLKFSVRPGVRFLTPTSAEVRWETTLPGTAALAYGPTRKLGKVVTSKAAGTSHRVVISDLVPGQDYYYRFGLQSKGKRSFSPFFQLDGGMNYTPPIHTAHQPASASNKTFQKLVQQLKQHGGYAVVSPTLDPSWSELIAAETSFTVIATGANDESVRKLRQRWYKNEQYGIRLSVQLTNDLPRTFANLVVTDVDHLAEADALRAPLGAIVAVGAAPRLGGFKWTPIADRVAIGFPSAAPKLANWGHQYGPSGNASFSGETLGGVDNTADLEMKWIGRPGADFGIDRNPRMPAPLAVGGRLFHQGMNRMIALDAFNGAVLWSLEIPDLRRVNIPRDSANWCADTSHVYAAVKDRLWVIDAASGKMLRTMLLPHEYGQDFQWGYVAVTEDLVLGTAMKTGSDYTGFWDKASWYDGKDDAATAKVCGDAIVAYDKVYGNVVWQRPTDAIVHSTIAIAGDHVYFVEVDDPSLKVAETGKLINKRIWNSASVVCLDLGTGKQLWKSKVPPQDHEAIISFGIADSDQYVLQTSGKNQFHFVSLNAKSGKSQWSQDVDWPEDHHGAHIQHAVLMNGRIYVQPHILDAATGKVVKSGTLGKRRGCATPIGAGNSIVYRGGSGPLSLWSLDDDKPSEFTRLRPSCWLSTIPAQGMLFSPEGGGGCSCGGWMETSIGFAPLVEDRR